MSCKVCRYVCIYLYTCVCEDMFSGPSPLGGSIAIFHQLPPQGSGFTNDTTHGCFRIFPTSRNSLCFMWWVCISCLASRQRFLQLRSAQSCRGFRGTPCARPGGMEGLPDPHMLGGDGRGPRGSLFVFAFFATNARNGFDRFPWSVVLLLSKSWHLKVSCIPKPLDQDLFPVFKLEYWREKNIY